MTFAKRALGCVCTMMFAGPLTLGCASSVTDETRVKPEPVGTVQQALTATDCLDPSNQPLIATAYRHTPLYTGQGAGQYWAPFPNSGDGAPYSTYEWSVFSIPRANGYEYKV